MLHDKDCEFTLKVIADNPKNIERLVKILDNNDTEYFVPGAYDVRIADYPREKHFGEHTGYITGHTEYTTTQLVKNPTSRTIETDLRKVCAELNMAIECWADSMEAEFQEHFAINNLGQVIAKLQMKKYEVVIDMNGDTIHGGGFNNYGRWLDSSKLFVKR